MSGRWVEKKLDTRPGFWFPGSGGAIQTLFTHKSRLISNYALRVTKTPYPQGADYMSTWLKCAMD